MLFVLAYFGHSLVQFVESSADPLGNLQRFVHGNPLLFVEGLQEVDVRPSEIH